MLKLRRLLRDRVGRARKDPIIILGNQKSGTSAIAHLLADYGGLSKRVDVRPLWPPTGRDIMLGRTPFADVVARYPGAFSAAVIKEPMMTFFAPQVVDRFPAARFVFVIRDPRTNIRSLLNWYGMPGDLPEIPPELKPAAPAMFTDVEVWGEGANYIEMLANRWNRAANVWLTHRDHFVLVKYESFLADKVGCIARLATASGVTRARDISTRVNVPYQPPGDTSVTAADFFGPANLRRIETICGPTMRRLGYRPDVD